MAENPRNQIARLQAVMVAALAGQAAPPAGANPDHLDRTARMLLAKRIQGAKKAWPQLTRCLAERFSPLFERYAQEHSCPGAGGHGADAMRFALWLLSRDELPDAGRQELMMSRLREQRFAAMWLPESGRIALAARLPLLGVRRTVLRWRARIRPLTAQRSPPTA